MTKRSLEIYVELWRFRKELEERYEWRRNPHIFYNTCDVISELAIHKLHHRGILKESLQKIIIYVEPSNKFYDLHKERVLCQGQRQANHVIVYDKKEKVGYDLTRDQFYPEYEFDYRVIREEYCQIAQNIFWVESVDNDYLPSEDILYNFLEEDVLPINKR